MPFGEPKFIGKSYIIDDASIVAPREAYQLEFFAYQMPVRAMSAHFVNPTSFKQRIHNTVSKMRNMQYWAAFNPVLGETV